METAIDNVPSSGSGSSSGGGGGSSSRWNPTKEQLSMLEGLYGQGIRTPSAEQIQSIAKRLQVYGHIEGKNVFYWFQNHKARQRQKQKMDQMTSANNNVVINSLNNNNGNAVAYFNRFYYQSPQVPPSVASATGDSHPLYQGAPNNVVYSPYYIAQPEFGFYPHRPKMVLSSHLVNNNQTSGHVRHDLRRENIVAYAAQNAPDVVRTNSASAYSINGMVEGSGQVTLNLFPLQPTGILRDKEHQSPSIGSSTENSQEAQSEQDRTPAVQTSSSPSGFGFDVFSRIG